MTVDKNGMCTLSDEDVSYHSYNNSRSLCKCYHAERNFIGKIGVCYGTKECEACSCGGDERKCDFYDYVRKRATKKPSNADRIRTMTDEELANWLYDIITDFSDLTYPWQERSPNCDSSCIGTAKTCRECWLNWLQKEA